MWDQGVLRSMLISGHQTQTSRITQGPLHHIQSFIFDHYHIKQTGQLTLITDPINTVPLKIGYNLTSLSAITVWSRPMFKIEKVVQKERERERETPGE